MATGDTLRKHDAAGEFIESLRRPATQRNTVRDINPLIVFAVLSCITQVAVLRPGLIAPAILCAMLAGISLLAGVGRVFVPRYLKLFVTIGLVLFAFRAVFEPGDTVLAAFGPLRVTHEGVMIGARFALVVMVLCGALTLYAALVPAKYVMLALEERGVTPRATYVLLASFQAIKDLSRNVRVVADAQKSRGIETEGNVFMRARAFLPIIGPAFLAALGQAEERAIALDARAFNSEGKHTRLVCLRSPRIWEYALLAVAVAGTVFSMTGVAP
ncbi:hypothetical protein FJ960_09005 [Mesorhizobium sp. B2-3-11]|uniref:energy-coupling factor transporter transmembrane component T n=1 Tax=Mesorhizobium sp. B2-3-11 TaxID=2589953 RepID=UPI001126DD4D|nr:energy-coupling factor transporter transmembrane component T [Mesorhizobium sp. B2-3-11]TPM07048.1 hypothetical protein FJ960_09005 [Mesorhizobium sp. B2-3-11]